MSSPSDVITVPVPVQPDPSSLYREMRDRLEVWLNNNLDEFKQAFTDLVREGKVSREAIKGNRESSSPPPRTSRTSGRKIGVTAFGITQNLHDWCRASGLNRTTLVGRISRGKTLEQALTTPDYSGNRYYRDMELRGKPITDHLVIGQTRLLSDEEKRTIRNDPTRYTLLDTMKAEVRRLIEETRQVNKRVDENAKLLDTAEPFVPYSIRAGRPFREIPSGKTCVFQVWRVGDPWVGVKVTGHPDHNILLLGDYRSRCGEDFVDGIRKALLHHRFPVGPRLLIIDGRIDGEPPAQELTEAETEELAATETPSPTPETTPEHVTEEPSQEEPDSAP
jgi:hypothetical protein